MMPNAEFPLRQRLGEFGQRIHFDRFLDTWEKKNRMQKAVAIGLTGAIVGGFLGILSVIATTLPAR